MTGHWGKTGMNAMQGNGVRVRTVLIGAVVWLAAWAAPLHAEVHQPNGEYRLSETDLRVKVLGGTVTVVRTWQAVNVNKGEYRWYFNPAWADLDLDIDSGSDAIRSVSRTGAKFAQQGEDLYVLKESDRAYFIRVQRDANGERTGLRWSDRLGNAIDYDANGRVRSYNDRNGVAVTFERDAEGHLQTIRDGATPAKTILTFTWTNGQVSEIADYSGRRVQYHYTGAALTEVIDVLGHAWHYSYQGGLLKTHTDPEGHATTLDYQGNRVVKQTDASGNATTWTYDYNRGTRQYDIKETSPDGKLSYSRYDADGKLVEQTIGSSGGGRTVSRTVKESANVDIAYDERNLPTRTEYDANRNPIKVTYPDGSSTTATWDARYSLPLTRTDELGVKTTYEYDAKGNLTTLTEAAGLPEQRTTTATYNAMGQRLTQTVKGQTPADDATTTWTYDAYGNVQSITDAENHTTAFEFDAMGNVTKRTDARGKVWRSPTNAAGWTTSQKDPLGHETVITYDTAGNRTTVTDPEHHTTTYTYTPTNRLEAVTDPLGGVTTTHYTKDGQRKDETDANGVKTSFGYDADGRLTTITDGAQNVTTLVYGRTCADTPAAGLEGLLTATKYPTYCEEYKYDVRGNRTQVIRVLPNDTDPPERQVTTTGYDAKGQTISTTDPLGRTTQSAYGALGRLKAVTDAAGGTTAYTYDASDNLKTVTDANQHTHTFSYDKVNRVTSEARPLGQAIGYTYDEVGRLTVRTSPNGERRQYGYDDAGRRTTENQYPRNSQAPSQTVAYTYDGNNRLTGYTQTGDTESSAIYVYDAKGQKLDETVTYGTGTNAISKTIHYAYEPNGLKKSLTYPDGTAQTSTYDKNRLKDITIKGNTIRYQDYQWRVPTKVTMPGATRTLTYDALQRPTQIKSESVAGAIIMDYRYQYDAAGNITQRDTEDGAYDYTYDRLDRLTGATPPISVQQSPANPNGLPVEQYTYDPVHNRKTSAHQPGNWTYNANNELNTYGTGADEQTYAYDANGNTVEQKTGNPQSPSKTRQFIYNAAERLSEVKDNGTTIGKYQYDPMGRRFRKETSQGITWFQYADEGLIAEYTPNDTLQRTYGWRPSGLWGGDPVWLADVSAATWSVNYYHNDHLGTSQRMTNANGTMTWKGVSEAFGETKAIADAANNPLRYPGQYKDREFSANYNNNRYYAPADGRYIEADPLGIVGGVALYSYSRNNAIKYFDNYGLYVNWSGSMTSFSVVSGFGAMFSFYTLESECKCGIKYKIRGYASLLMFGIGASWRPAAQIGDLAGGGGGLDMIDPKAECPSPDAANGAAVYVGLSAAPLASFATTRGLGDLVSTSWIDGPSFGFDFSAGLGIGASYVLSSEKKECCE